MPDNLDIHQKKINLLMEQLNKEFGTGTIMKLDEEPLLNIEVVSSGAFTLDLATGIGGFPRGHIVELYGPESAGKTTLALSTIANAHKQGLNCMYIDAEHVLDMKYAYSLGVQKDKFYLSQPNSGEEAFDILIKAANTGEFGIAVIDSIAALSPLAEIEGSMEQQFVGLHPRMVNKGIRKATAACHEGGTLVIAINQIREKVGVMFGNPETTPGGRQLKHNTAMRVGLTAKKVVASSGEILGIKTTAKIHKNKMSFPHNVAEFDIRWGKGIDNTGCIVDMAFKHGILTKSGNWYQYGDDKLGNGREQTISFLDAAPDTLEEIKQKILVN